jgi:hypothetical protein
MGEARRRREVYLKQAAELLERHTEEALRDRVPVYCLRCGQKTVAVPATLCDCGGPLLNDHNPNGAQPQNDPNKISLEVYLLDQLIAHAATTAGACRFRGNTKLADVLDNLCVVVGPGQAMLLRQFREALNTETYGKTPTGLVVASEIPKVTLS